MAIVTKYPTKSRMIRKRAFYSGAQGRHFKRSGAQLQGTLSNWTSSIIHSRLAEAEKRKVADRAWDLYINDAMGHGVVEGIVRQAVNIGITPQLDPMRSILGMSSEAATRYQEIGYDLFESWGLDFRNFCDAQRRLNFYMLEALAFFQWQLQGVALFQTVFMKNSFSPLSISFLPIDPARAVTPYDMSLKKEIYDGFELDKNGRIKAVYILKPEHESASYAPKEDDCYRFTIENSETGLPNILVVCDVRNISEYKQDSILTSMIKEIRDSNDIVDASLIKVLVHNLWTGFLKSSAEAVRQHGVGEATTQQDWDDRILEFDKGTILTGLPGEEIDWLQSNAPGDNYEKMNASIIGRLGMATGRGPENIARSYQASYSASRASIEDATKFDEYDRMILINRFCAPAISWALYEAALKGMLPVRSINHFKENLYAYTRANWLPPPARQIDHLKEAKADGERLENHTITYSDIWGQRSKDWKQKLRQTAAELKYISELEIEFGVDLSVLKGRGGQAENDNEGDD